MKRFTSTRLFAIVCMIVMGFVQTWAQDNTTVTVKAPTITPGSCEYNGTIMPVITADEGCSGSPDKLGGKILNFPEKVIPLCHE